MAFDPSEVASGQLPVVRLKSGEDGRLQAGHRWVFSNELVPLSGSGAALPPGAPCLLANAQGRLLGFGHANLQALLAVRLLAGTAGAYALLEGRLTEAELVAKLIRDSVARRQSLMALGRQAFRLIFSEGDDLPGLIVDRYGEILVVQILTAGMHRLREVVLDALMAATGCGHIFERTSGPYLAFEQLEERREWLRGGLAMPLHVPPGDGLPAMSIDLTSAQKTGAFLDQSDNRAWLAGWLLRRRAARPHDAGTTRLLDLFCYHAHWSATALLTDAALEACAVDSSAPALESARATALLNGVEKRLSAVQADVFEWLDASESAGPWDVVVLDPPALTKNRKSVPVALKAYEKLNMQAMRRTAAGGLLITCSCSQHVEPEAFDQLLVRAARRAKRRVRVVHRGAQSVDHPILLGMPETAYLKMVALEMMEGEGD